MYPPTWAGSTDSFASHSFLSGSFCLHICEGCHQTGKFSIKFQKPCAIFTVLMFIILSFNLSNLCLVSISISLFFFFFLTKFLYPIIFCKLVLGLTECSSIIIETRQTHCRHDFAVSYWMKQTDWHHTRLSVGKLFPNVLLKCLGQTCKDQTHLLDIDEITTLFSGFFFDTLFTHGLFKILVVLEAYAKCKNQQLSPFTHKKTPHLVVSVLPKLPGLSFSHDTDVFSVLRNCWDACTFQGDDSV